ncbi:phosphate ABC transporter substrate-binding protein [Pseudoalteromonas sp. NBT06-2]|uniref:phosphate ABC transporter substrate-binding protein n=1 Tax=Pseudoalteromonas sp. NBT06-2 TaxID=2025950 RepID=UPI000BA56B6E|nr:phosphate ABC transporter substrate-binding protein [Pseudoalteromonas sp. NBT06-2]PAJ76149.1 phosphate ABC transporter substrate-binding protein [Pseudoalteromonas sp. NBT06-2]
MKLKLCFLPLICCSHFTFADITVIVHPSNSNAMDASSISRLFLGKSKKFPDGSIAIPLNQIEASSATAQFNSKALRKSSSQIKAYWSKLVFTGKGSPPKSVENNAAVLDLVSSNPNIIGYVESNVLTDKVKVKVLKTF